MLWLSDYIYLWLSAGLGPLAFLLVSYGQSCPVIHMLWLSEYIYLWLSDYTCYGVVITYTYGLVNTHAMA